MAETWSRSSARWAASSVARGAATIGASSSRVPYSRARTESTSAACASSTRASANLPRASARYARSRYPSACASVDRVHEGVHVLPAAFHRRDPGEVHHGRDDAWVEVQDALPGGTGFRDRATQQRAVMKLDLAELDPRLDVVGIRPEDAAVQSFG